MLLHNEAWCGGFILCNSLMCSANTAIISSRHASPMVTPCHHAEQDRLEAQPVRFMEIEALAAIRQAQLALAEVRTLATCHGMSHMALCPTCFAR